LKTDLDISPDEEVTVTQTNHLVEVQHMTHMNPEIKIRKLDKYHYLDLETGEIREFDLSDNRAGNQKSLKKTFKKLRYLINNNFSGAKNELHATLTYAENMTSHERLYKDFDKFMKRLRYSFEQRTSIDYICVVEPQARGAWHCHVLLRFNDLDKVYVPNNELAKLWRQGYVNIRTLKGVDNIAAYLSAYLSNIELPPEIGDWFIKSDIGKKQIKRVGDKVYLKGGRLHMYPSGVNLYRKSKGIKHPDRPKMPFKAVGDIVGSATPHYQQTYTIEKDDYKNTISFMQYNLKRSDTGK
jgi:hypothetical protein